MLVLFGIFCSGVLSLNYNNAKIRLNLQIYKNYKNFEYAEKIN